MLDPTAAVTESGENASALSLPTVIVCTPGAEEDVEVAECVEVVVELLGFPPPYCARANEIKHSRSSWLEKFISC
jgi:hypothetical protein